MNEGRDRLDLQMLQIRSLQALQVAAAQAGC
jgi:hypothetical protein